MDIILSIIEKITDLINVNRIERRELLFTLIKPIYDDLENVHSNYIITFSNLVIKIKNNEISIKEALTKLEEERFIKLAERDKIQSIINRLLLKKWNPKVRTFMESVRDYFTCNSASYMTDIPHKSLFYVYYDLLELPSNVVEDLVKFEEKMIYQYTGYTSLINVMCHLNTLEYEYEKKIVEKYPNLKEKIDQLPKDSQLYNMIVGKRISDKKYEITINYLNQFITELCEKWKYIVAAYTEIQISNK